MSLWYDSYFYSSSKISAFDNQVLVAVLAYCTILEVIIFDSNCTFFISRYESFPFGVKSSFR